jgi:hypothetical protein
MKLTLTLLFIGLLTGAVAQSKTTQTLEEQNPGALSAFFYHNTLRMLNQSENKEYDELIKDIEKMKFLLIDKTRSSFDQADWKKLVNDYRAEQFEEIMTSRMQGKNFNIYIKEVQGVTKGMLVLINDSTNLYVLDVVGRIALDKVGTLYKTLDESADFGGRIKNFTAPKEKRKEDNN